MASKLKRFFRKKRETAVLYWLTAFLIGTLTGIACVALKPVWVIPFGAIVFLLTWGIIRERSYYSLSRILGLPAPLRFVGQVARVVTGLMILLKDDQNLFQEVDDAQLTQWIQTMINTQEANNEAPPYLLRHMPHPQSPDTPSSPVISPALQRLG